MASDVDIANRALQRIGARKIGSIEEDPSREAIEVRAMYNIVRDAELRMNAWRFSITRAQIAALTTTPLFGRTFEFLLPSDYVRTVPLDPKINFFPTDWLYEKDRILTDDPGPIDLRYVSRDVASERYDPLFVEALGARLAMELGPTLVQPNTTAMTQLESAYQFHISAARRLNAIEIGPTEPNIDTWEAVRRRGRSSGPQGGV